MTATQTRLKPGDQIEIATRADGIQPATVQAVVDGYVLLTFEQSIKVTRLGDRSDWMWIPEASMREGVSS